MSPPLLLTKRIILSQIATLYDPLGLLTPFSLKAKILMRDVVMDSEKDGKGGWDEPVSAHLYERAVTLFEEMFLLEELEFPRCMKPLSTVGLPELLIFSDSSTKAYGAAAYIRWELTKGTYCCHLICSKNRIAPIRQLSIPRLELFGAVDSVA